MYKEAIALLFAIAAAAPAQNSNGYGFIAPGGIASNGFTTMTWHAGGGIDAIIGKGLGVNVELGALWPNDYFSEVVGVFSPGGTYYFRHGKGHKVEPFVNGGYTLMFRSGHANLGYAGAGLNYWFTRRIGLRLEVRDNISISCCGSEQFFGFRLGVAFR